MGRQNRVFFLFIIAALAIGCSQGTKYFGPLSDSSQSSSSGNPVLQPTPSPTPVSTPVSTPNPTPSSSPSPTGTPIPTPSPTPVVGAPTAVTNLQIINQGGPNNDTNPLTNYQAISWSAATSGSNAIAYYQIYRNGLLYDRTTDANTLTYADTKATNSNDPTWATAATSYAYQVAAVDTVGRVGPLASQMSLFSYQNGKSNVGNRDLSWGGPSCLQENYSSMAGSPQGGSFDIMVTFTCGGFQPESWTPLVPPNDMELGGFNYFTVDMNPGSSITFGAMKLGMVTMLRAGEDTFGWHPNVSILNYGPAPKPNTWATYQVPLADVAVGKCQFKGSISGTTLTVSSIVSGAPIVDSGGIITGPGIPAGTQVIAYGQNSAIGTFTLRGPGISSSTNIPEMVMTFQRTSLYKFAIFPDTAGTAYFNNMGFNTYPNH